MTFRSKSTSLALAALTVLAARPSVAQERDGSPFAAGGTAVLAAYSGAVLGLLGGVTPCAQVTAPATCSRVWVMSGGAVAGVSGLFVGSGDSEAAGRIGTSAAIGFGIGAATGAVLKPLVHHFGWPDVLALGLVGGAIGAAPRGAGLGLGAGVVVGSAAWALIPGVAFDDAVAISLMGLAVGGLSEWVIRAADARTGPSATVPLASLRF
jgi:hypothetical protein